jgi:nuclear pore complex protein Nup98-Nup96
LREIQANAFLNRKLQEDSPKVSSVDKQQKGFTTSIDLMNSLFRQPPKHDKSPMKKQNVQDKGFEV